ncbi:MAG: transglutaminase family protein [Phycisphaerales bacterium JB038]
MEWSPTHVVPAAAELLADATVRIESDDGLLDAAIAVAIQIEPTTTEAEPVRERLEQLHDAIRRRTTSASPTAALAHLHGVLFDDLGFRGNSEEYDHRDNSNIQRVLETRRGLPIMLTLVYVLVARRLDLEAWGVGMPGHFLAGVRADQHRQLIDCFHRGRMLTEQDAYRLYQRIAGADAVWEKGFLEPVSHLEWVTRMINNLRYQAHAAGDREGLRAHTELLSILYPDDRELADELSRMPSDLT